MPAPGATRGLAQPGDDLRRQLDPPGAVGYPLDAVQDTRVAPSIDRRLVHLEQLRGDPRKTASVRPISLGTCGQALRTTGRNLIFVSNPNYHALCEAPFGAGSESLLIEDLGDLAVRDLGRQLTDASQRGGVGPACIARAFRAGDVQEGAGFRSPADRHLDRRLGPRQADILDQESEQLFALDLRRRGGLP